MEDQEASDAALQRLIAAAFGDGMLPEAYDPDGSGSAVRHWFAWPGSALGALLLDHATREAGE
jgi:meiotically up-regulated gene 157 (Mug157) protein